MRTFFREKWRDLSPLHRKRAAQGFAAWVFLVAALALWLGLNAGETRERWLAAIPSAETLVVKQDRDAASPATTAVGAEDSEAPVFPAADQPARITVIVTGLGLAADVTEAAIKDLPPEITLAFSPYSPSLESWLDASIGEGHENLIALPMEPDSYPRDDPGPRALLSRGGADENARNLSWALRHGEKIKGAVSFMGSRFLKDDRKVRVMLDTFKRSGLTFVDATEPENLVPVLASADIGAKTMKADVVLDAPVSAIDVRRRLAQLEQAAQKNGHAVGVFAAYPAVVPALKEWLVSNLASRNLALSPVGKAGP